VIATSVFNGSRFDRASRSNRVTVTPSPERGCRVIGEAALVDLSSARDVAEHLFASGFGELAHLGVNALAVSGYPGVAVFHASLMTVTYAKEKPFWIKAVIFFHNS
jgi:hypothetical protein